MPVSIRRTWSAFRALLAALVVVGLVAFVSTPSFAASPGPTVSSVSPNSGRLAGGSTVTIAGSGFSAITAVTFGGVPAPGFAVQSPNLLTATVPAHAAGFADVEVTGALGSSAVVPADRYDYLAAPAVTGVSPNNGAIAGGTAVTITGSGFTGAQQVEFGGIPDASFTIDSSTQITAVTSAESAGATDVRVLSPQGESPIALDDQFVFATTPTITSFVGGSIGVVAGGTVQIQGTGFVGPLTVSFGGVTATAAIQTLGTALTVTAPAHAAGDVSVSVTSAYGTSNAATYTYESAPVIQSLSRNSASVAGGGSNNVVIGGSGFTDATGVVFGTVPSPSVSVISDGTISASIPAHLAGLVDVHVVLGDGSSAITAADHFTYLPLPTVTAVSPAVGADAGGNLVTITGTGFTGASVVDFGGSAGTIVGTPTATKVTATAPASGGGGSVDITVTAQGGTSAGVTADRYTYIAPPSVSSLSVASGITAGGGMVTVSGANFTGATKVTFGGVAGTSLAVLSSTQLTVKTPAHAAGTTDIQVVTPYGTSSVVEADQFTYGAAPTVTSLLGNQGPVGGGGEIQIGGANLANATGVMFGTVAATGFTMSKGEAIAADVPAHSAGTVDITVLLGNGASSVVAADRFTYEPLPAVSGLSVSAGVLGGANIITLRGTNFIGVSKVYFGATASTKVVAVSTTQLTVTVPAHAAGAVDVEVVGTYGRSSAVMADEYTYEPVPAITSVSPAAGALAGLTPVTVNGTGFFGTAKVEFGTTLATNVVVVSSTEITATLPAHAAGTVDVRVVGQYGTSPVAAADHYLYQSTGSISGVVTGGSPSAARADVQVSAFDGAGDLAGTATTGASGAYSVTGLAAGSYTLDFTPTDQGFAPEWWGGAALQSAATPIILTTGQALTGRNVTLVAAGGISGVVAGPEDSPSELLDIDVLAFDADGNFAGSADTIGGQYQVNGLAPGNYTLHFVPQSGTADAQTYDPTWLGNWPTQAGSALVPVEPGAVTTEQNIALAVGGTINGEVEDASSDPVDDVTVGAYDSSGTWVAGGSTATDGTFSIGGLPTGSYTLKFTPIDDAPQWYSGATVESAATTIPVTEGSGSEFITMNLVGASSISGTVTGSIDSAALEGVEVSAYDADGNWAGGAVTDSMGEYQIDGLAAGQFTLSFTPPTDAYAPQWFDGELSQATADPIQVPVDADVTNQNAILTPMGSISGTVLGNGASLGAVADVSVNADDAAGNVIATATTNAFGYYSITGLPAGSYALDFVPNGSTFGAEWWSGASSEAAATLVPLSTGSAITGYNITLVGASISGAVLNSLSAPIPGVRVYAIDAAGDGIAQATTSSLGVYTLTGIPAGSYTLEFVPAAGSGYATQWWTNQLSQSRATYISVTSGLAVTGKSVVLLSTGGSVAGTVTTGGSTDVAGVDVYLYNSVGNLVGSTTTDGGGNYSLPNLAAGSYSLLVSDTGTVITGEYVDQWYSGKNTEATATPIVVTSAATTVANVDLVANGTIAGTVDDSDDPGVGLSNVQVNAVNSAGSVVNSATTDGNGDYEFAGLPAGSYALQFTAAGFAPQWYSNEPSLATASRITVTPGTATSDADATLTHGATISGFVTDPPPGTESNIAVAALYSNGAFAAQTTTDASGDYQLTNLAAGTYTLEFTPNAPDGVWWYGQSAYGAQLVVTVTANQVLAQNVTLTVAGTVSGVVTDTSDDGAFDVFVTLEDAATQATVASAGPTGDDGAFGITDVPHGTYVLDFQSADQSYVNQVSSPFTVGTGNESPVENIQLVTGASISGTITGDDNPGVGLSGIDVILQDGDGNFVEETSTVGDGTYSFGGLAAGPYRVVIDTQGDGYATVTFDASLSTGQSLGDQDVALPVASDSISGTVSGAGASIVPLGNIQVGVFDEQGNFEADAVTDSNGNYTVTGLAPGTYAVEFAPSDPSPYIPTWWNGAASEASAKLVTLGIGDNLANISPVLAQGATFSGTVFTAGTPNQVAAFFGVNVYDPEGDLIDSVNANAFGQYTTDGLAPGKYTLEFLQPLGGGAMSYLTEWLGGSASQTGAQMITVLGAQQLTGENAVLPLAASISGTVVDTSGDKLDGITVPVWMLVAGTYVPVASTQTHADGTYSLTGLGAGTYKIGFSDYASGDGSTNAVFGDQFWSAGPTLGSATPITLTSGQASTGKNATMTKISALAALTTTPKPTITGTAKSGTKLTAVPGTWAPATVVLTYQWERGGSVVPGATSSTYTLSAADVGQQITVVVTGQKVGYRPQSETSNATAIVSG